MSNTSRLLAASLLSATRRGPVNRPEWRGTVKVTEEAFDAFIMEAEAAGLFTLTGDLIELGLTQRLDLAAYAIRRGVDPEAVGRSLSWLEFEEYAARVLEENGFRVRRRFRFTAEGRRWEIDLLAWKPPHLVAGECKRWEKGLGNQTTRSIAEIHLEKTRVFAANLEGFRSRVGLEKAGRLTVVPMLLTLSSTPLQLYRRIPSVSVVSLPRFLEEYDGYLDAMTGIEVHLPEYVKPERKRRTHRL